jgi:hypothetical protein
MPPLPSGATAGAESGFTVSAAGPAGGMAQAFAGQTRVVSPELSKDMEPKTESLGTKTIDGVQVTGTRSTNTIPAGAIGNDNALVITRETWYSPELQLVVESTQNDRALARHRIPSRTSNRVHPMKYCSRCRQTTRSIRLSPGL